ncbi:MAG TPA: DUF6616 family protein [Acidimicrobiia bacterium]|jgi:hypothetical protein
MQMLVELWKARPSWHEWSPDERVAYLERAGPAIRALLAGGAQLVAIGAADATNGHQPDYDYWVVWRFLDADQLTRFTETLERIGWLDHFEPVNAGVEGRPLQEILAEHGL